MSKQAVDKVVRKATTDANFRAQLARDFEVAIKPYKLTPAEKAQVRTSASAKISANVPEREAARNAARLLERKAPRVSSRVSSRVTSRVTSRKTV